MSSFISTQSISSSMRQSVLRMQSELAANQTELSTGNYADIGLTLGAQTGQSVSLQTENSFLQAISDTNTAVSTRLSTTQNVLSSLQSSARNLLNSLIETNGATSTASTVQTSAESNLQSMISSLNTSLNGEYIFAGENTGNAPLTDYYGGAAANKQAVDAAFSTAFGISQSSTGVSGITGDAIQSFLDNQFASLFQGSNWTSNWSSASNQALISQISPNQMENTSISANAPAFQQLAQAYSMVADLGVQNLSSGAFGAVVSAAEGLLTSAIGNLTNLQDSVGVVQAAVTNATSQMSLQINLLSTQVSNLDSVNTYEVSTQITDLQTQLETSYSLTSQLSQLSLVKFL